MVGPEGSCASSELTLPGVRFVHIAREAPDLPQRRCARRLGERRGATCIDFVLRSASQYDDHSKDAIAGKRSRRILKECCDISPASFSGAAHLPALLDACRASLVARPAAARVLSALYTACTLKDASEVNWTAAIAAADRLLCIGLYKREITGPVLPGPLADSVRRLRKLLQTRINAECRSSPCASTSRLSSGRSGATGCAS